VVDSSLRFQIDAEFTQFYVQDVEPYDAWMSEHASDAGTPSGGWTDDALDFHGIGLEPHSISVGTARDGVVDAVIAVHDAEPVPEQTAEHIVEADLDAPTGKLSVFSVGDQGPTVVVPVGLLRVRISHIPSEPPVTDSDEDSDDDSDDPGGHFLYRIDHSGKSGVWHVFDEIDRVDHAGPPGADQAYIDHRAAPCHAGFSMISGLPPRSAMRRRKPLVSMDP